MRGVRLFWLETLAVLGSYLLGAVPFGLLVTRRLGLGDPRAAGSGNIGATNVARLGGKKAGALTLLLDAAKGCLPVALGLAWLGPGPAAACGLAAFLGHCYPVYLGFRGGKGVATALGVLLAASPSTGLAVAALMALLVWLSGYVSLGSLGGCLSAPLWLWLLDAPPPFLGMATIMVGLVIWRHRENIRRLRLGQEMPWRSRS